MKIAQRFFQPVKLFQQIKLVKLVKLFKLMASRGGLRFIVVALAATCFYLKPAQAQFWSNREDSDSQNEIRKNAKERNYIGGADEDDLRVLPQIPGVKEKAPPAESEGF